MTAPPAPALPADPHPGPAPHPDWLGTRMAYVLALEAAIFGLLAVLAMGSFWTGLPEDPCAEARPTVPSFIDLHPAIPFAVSLAALAAALSLPWVNRMLGLQRTLHLLFLNRYALLLAAVPLALVPLGTVAAPSMLGGLLAVQGPGQLFNVAWMSVLVAAVPILSVAVAEHNAQDRYPLDPPPAAHPPRSGWSLWEWVACLLISLPLACACLRGNVEDRHVVGGEFKGGTAFWLWTALAVGVAFGFMILAVAQLAEKYLVMPRQRIRGLFPFPLIEALPGRSDRPWLGADLVGWYLRGFGPGYQAKPDGSGTPGLARGHAQLAVVLLLALAAYFTGYAFSLHRAPDRDSAFPALFFLLMLLGLAGLGMQGLAFWLDRYHISPLLAVAAFSVLMYLVNRTDHHFDLGNEKSGDETEERARDRILSGVPDFAKIVREMRPSLPASKGGQRTLVCVTAVGGGIQASAWTAKVMTELNNRYGDKFGDSVTLISAVSGGSVGTMFYLDALEERVGKPRFRKGALGPVPLKGAGGPPAGKEQGVPPILDLATRSSLEAAGWGFAYPDLLRTIFPPLAGAMDDRGARVEEDWRKRLHAGRSKAGVWRMHDRRVKPEQEVQGLRERMEKGTLPIAVFNATVAETGQRMLLWPFLSRPAAERAVNGRWPGPSEARELVELYPRSNLAVSTAVRLSATFSYISPICRPMRDDGTGASAPEAHCYHFCDGGYTDNEGAVTALDLLDALYDAEMQAWRRWKKRKQAFDKDPKAGDPGSFSMKYDRILVVRIQPFPTAGCPARAQGDMGWTYSTFGPLQALGMVRIASQAERNSLVFKKFREAVKDGEWFDEYDAQDRFEEERFKAVEFTFDPAGYNRGLKEDEKSAREAEKPMDEVVPLSWTLTERQKQDLDRMWNRIADPKRARKDKDRTDKENALRMGQDPEAERKEYANPLNSLDEWFELANAKGA